MFEITDLHNHSLYGVDDGAQDFATMCNMLDMAYADGIRHICFTPHFSEDCGEDYISAVQEHYQEACRYCKENCSGLTLYLAAEIMYHYDCIDSLNKNRQLLILGSRYVLTEFDMFTDSQSIKQAVIRLLNCGYIPVIAHVERYLSLHRHIDVVVDLLEAGALMQINADSLLGDAFSRQRRMCLRLLKKRLVSVVSSDAHDTEYRIPCLRKAVNLVTSKYGYEYAKQLFCDVPREILSNKNV